MCKTLKSPVRQPSYDRNALPSFLHAILGRHRPFRQLPHPRELLRRASWAHGRVRRRISGLSRERNKVVTCERMTTTVIFLQGFTVVATVPLKWTDIINPQAFEAGSRANGERATCSPINYETWPYTRTSNLRAMR